MALARCEKCGRPQGRKGNKYIQGHEPPNHPASGLVYGRSGCENSALVWLDTMEEEAYETGQRIFKLPTAAAKVQVT